LQIAESSVEACHLFVFKLESKKAAIFLFEFMPSFFNGAKTLACLLNNFTEAVALVASMVATPLN